MKKALYLFWCWLALGSIFWFIQVMIVANTGWTADPLSLLILSTSAILAGLAAWLISRRNLDAWARWLGVLYATLILACVLALFAFFCLAPVYGLMAHPVYWTVGAAFLVGIVAGVIISRKKILRTLGLIAAVLLLTVGVIAFHAHRQKAVIKDYEQKWAAMGWKMDLKSIYPMPYSKPQCETWFDAVTVIAPKSTETKGKSNSEWAPFYEEAVVPLCSDKVAEALEKGEEPKALVLSLPGSTDARWERYRTVEAAATTAMERCPHVQWFDPVEYQDKLWEAPIPNLLGLMKWTRGLVAQANIASANGRYDEARADLEIIHSGAEKMLIPGQTLIGTLIGIAMEKLSLVGQASAMAMGSGPLPALTRERVEEMAMQDLGWFAASWKTELMATHLILKSADAKQFGMMDAPLGKVIPLKTMVHRALRTEETENYLFNMTQTIQSLLGGYDRPAQKFGWAHHKSLKPKGSQLTPNLNASYGRALSLLAQARLVLLMDEALKYRQEHQSLPENLDFVATPWRTDPFDEKPLRYKKEVDNLFVVYSVGTDGRDDGGKKLYVSGVMEMKDELKEDIGFRILLPPPAR